MKLSKNISETWRGVACIVLETRKNFNFKNSLPPLFASISGGGKVSPPSLEITVSDFTFFSLIYIMENKYVDRAKA